MNYSARTRHVYPAIVVAILLSPFWTAGCIYGLTYKSLPEIRGEVIVPGLEQKVHIVRDTLGVPHILAATENDSYIALGYIHAQDRLWQMDMMRHLSQGRLSELVGNRKIDNPLFSSTTTLDLDVYNRVVGFAYLAEKGVERLDTRSLEILQLYASGINHFVEQNRIELPVEFKILGHEFEPWSAKDTAALYLYIAWGLNNDWYAELLRYAIAQERGVEKAWEILPLHWDPGPCILEEYADKGSPAGQPLANRSHGRSSMLYTPDVVHILRVDSTLRALNRLAGFPAASNNWVVSGTRTAHGWPLLCNDPHLPLTVPSIWYEVHIVRPGMDVIGVMFPGTPAIAIGRNRHIAWGNTTPFEDSMDLFIEKVNPSHPTEYLRDGTFVPFDMRTETIYYKKGRKLRSLERTVRMTVHGPVLNDVIPALRDSKDVISIRWTAYDLDFRNKGLNMLKLGEARCWEEFRQSIDIGIPIFNWVYADTQGNIGYIAPGLIPIRGKGDGTYPAPGWDPEYDWRGYVPEGDMPHLFNPARGYIVTANNQVFPQGAYPYQFSHRYMPSYRAARIKELLLQKDTLTVADMQRIQADVYSKQGERLTGYFIAAYDRSGGSQDPVLRAAVDALRHWDYQCDSDSIGATVFHVAYQYAITHILKDEMSSQVFKAFLSDDTFEISFDNLLEKDHSELFDDRNTEPTETKDELLLRSLKDAVIVLARFYGPDVRQWSWGNCHTIDMEHVTFGQVPVLKWLFNVGPYAMPGTRHTINNGFYRFAHDLPFRTFVGSSFREIIDLADPSHMYAVISTGQSGHRFSKHYKDQTPLWLNGRYTILSLDLTEVRARAEGELILCPPHHR